MSTRLNFKLSVYATGGIAYSNNEGKMVRIRKKDIKFDDSGYFLVGDSGEYRLSKERYDAAVEQAKSEPKKSVAVDPVEPQNSVEGEKSKEKSAEEATVENPVEENVTSAPKDESKGKGKESVSSVKKPAKETYIEYAEEHEVLKVLISSKDNYQKVPFEKFEGTVSSALKKAVANYEKKETDEKQETVYAEVELILADNLIKVIGLNNKEEAIDVAVYKVSKILNPELPEYENYEKIYKRYIDKLYVKKEVEKPNVTTAAPANSPKTEEKSFGLDPRTLESLISMREKAKAEAERKEKGKETETANLTNGSGNATPQEKPAETPVAPKPVPVEKEEEVKPVESAEKPTPTVVGSRGVSPKADKKAEEEAKKSAKKADKKAEKTKKAEEKKGKGKEDVKPKTAEPVSDVIGYMTFPVEIKRENPVKTVGYTKGNFTYKGKAKRERKDFIDSGRLNTKMQILFTKGPHGKVDWWVFLPEKVEKTEEVKLDNIHSLDEVKNKPYFAKIKEQGFDKYGRHGTKKHDYVLSFWIEDPKNRKLEKLDRMVVRDASDESKLGRLWLASNRRKFRKNNFNRAFDGINLPETEKTVINTLSAENNDLINSKKAGFVKKAGKTIATLALGAVIGAAGATLLSGDITHAFTASGVESESYNKTYEYIDETLAQKDENGNAVSLFNYEQEENGRLVVSPEKILEITDGVEQTASTSVQTSWWANTVSWQNVTSGLQGNVYHEEFLSGSAVALGEKAAEELYAHDVTMEDLTDEETGEMSVVYANGDSSAETFKEYLMTMGYSSEDAELYASSYAEGFTDYYETQKDMQIGGSEIKPSNPNRPTNPDDEVDHMEDDEAYYVNNENFVDIVSGVIGVPSESLTIETVEISQAGNSYENTIFASTDDTLYKIEYTTNAKATTTKELYTQLAEAQKKNEVAVDQMLTAETIYTSMGVRQAYIDGIEKKIAEMVKADQNETVKEIYYNFDDTSKRVDGVMTRGGNIVVVTENGNVYDYRGIDVSTKKNVSITEGVVAGLLFGQFNMSVQGVKNPNDYIVKAESEVTIADTFKNEAETYVEPEIEEEKEVEPSIQEETKKIVLSAKSSERTL